MVAVMGLIYVGSTDLLSVRQTSRFIGPVLRWFVPDISERAIREVQWVVRKAGHVTEYAVLTIVLWHALHGTAETPKGRWRWREAGWAIGLAVFYAVTDELHQSFVSTRTASGSDVLIDTGGAAVGICLVWLWGRLLKRW